MSFEEFMQAVFGGPFDLSKLTTIFTAIYAIFISICEWRSKMKAIKADKELSSYDKKLDAQAVEMKEVKTAISVFADMLLTAYLSNNSVPEDIKKKLAACGDKLDHIAGIELKEDTKKIMEVVTDVLPIKQIEEHKEEIIAEAEEVEKVIDEANEVAQNAIDKIKLS